MLSAPTSTAPAASIRSIKVASRLAGGRSQLIFDPARVERPCTSNRFFTANGTPASGPTDLPAASVASIALALARARSAVTSVKALRTLSCAAMRDSAASVASTAVILRLDTACAISAAVLKADMSVIAISGRIDGGRLGLVRQRELIDQPCQPQRHLEVRAHRGTPGLLHRQRHRAGDSVDIVVEMIGHFAPSRVSQDTGNGGCGIAVSSSLV